MTAREELARSLQKVCDRPLSVFVSTLKAHHEQGALGVKVMCPDRDLVALIEESGAFDRTRVMAALGPLRSLPGLFFWFLVSGLPVTWFEALSRRKPLPTITAVSKITEDSSLRKISLFFGCPPPPRGIANRRLRELSAALKALSPQHVRALKRRLSPCLWESVCSWSESVGPVRLVEARREAQRLRLLEM